MITGIASTPSPDRDGDILEPRARSLAVRSRFSGSMTIPARGAVYGAPGQRRAGNHGNTGKPVPDMPSQLAARLDEVWAALRPGWSGGCPWASVPMNTPSGRRRTAFSALGTDGGVCRHVPANAECTIRTIKSYDRPFSPRPATGNRW